MCVVVFVARQAVGSECGFEDRLNMASLALDIVMSPVQGVAGIREMIETYFRPARARVAGFALFPEMAFVVVVFKMTIDALHRQLIGERVVTMTGLAFLLRMFVLEQKACITIVIEARVVPAQRAMAVAALVAAAAVMCVILGMTAVTGRGRIRKRVVGMTVKTRRPLVFTNQRIPRRVVIELDLQPVVRGMTISALCAKRSGVRVVIFVTGKAVPGRVAMSLLGLMAIIALIVRVLAEQREVRLFVVERILIEADDIGIAAFVVCMAFGADTSAGLTVFAMKSGFRFYVSGDLLMAIEAQCSLLAALESQMAVATIFLILGMCFDDLTRHDQSLDLCACGTGNSHCQSHQESEYVCAMPHASRPNSVNVDREDVNECRQHHQEEDRQVQDVPQGEQAFVQRELRDTPRQNGEVTDVSRRCAT